MSVKHSSDIELKIFNKIKPRQSDHVSFETNGGI